MFLLTLALGCMLAYGIIYFAQASINANTVRLMASSAAGELSIDIPAASSTVRSPVHFVVHAHTKSAITHMSIYDGNRLVYSADVPNIDESIILPAGGHRLVKAQAWDSGGNVFLATTHFTVASGTAQ